MRVDQRRNLAAGPAELTQSRQQRVAVSCAAAVDHDEARGCRQHDDVEAANAQHLDLGRQVDALEGALLVAGALRARRRHGKRREADGREPAHHIAPRQRVVDT
jgi:hypothetical protein